MENPPQQKAHSFEFINVTGGSGRERKRNNYLARARAAKINRQNYKSQADSRRSKHAQTCSILPKAFTIDLNATDSSNEDETSSEDNVGHGRTVEVCSTGRSSRYGVVEISKRSERTSASTVEPVPTPRSISPAYGAISIDTFDCNSQPVSAQVGHYLLKVSWPARSGEEVTRAWWTEFCQTPIIYHVSHLAAAVHRDLLVGETSWTLSPEILQHKTDTIRMINEQLARLPSLDHKAMDQLIFAVCTLSRHEMEAKHFEPGHVLLFTPHMPYANGMKPLGRFNLSESAREVLVQLVNSQGGLRGLKILGLGEILALIDILESSTGISRPRFPPFWDPGDSMEFTSFAGIGDISPGRGFSNLAGSITAQAAASFRSLAHADMIMAHHDLVPTKMDVKSILHVRNTAIHSVLSLPSWAELPICDRDQTDFVIYEACRTTAVIYSNAVLLGLPPHSGWHRNFVGTLRAILEAADLNAWAEYAPDVLIWCLFVGSVASYRTPHRQFFEMSLRDVLLLTGMLSWDSVRRCLVEFLWSENACQHGVAVIWDAMDLDGAWPC